MSIIYDALQKTQHARQASGDNKDAAPARAPQINVSAKSARKTSSSASELTRLKVGQVFLNCLNRCVGAIGAKQNLLRSMVTVSVTCAMLIVVMKVAVTSQDGASAIQSAANSMPKKSFAAAADTVTVATIWQSLKDIMPGHGAINEAQFKASHTLNGVFISNDEKIAMVDNKMYHRGEVIDGVEITAIDNSGVQMRYREQTIFLSSPV